MKKIIFCLIILIFVSTIAYAQEYPRSPGRHTAQGHIQANDLWCVAYYPYPYDNFPNVESIGSGTEPVLMKVVINNNKVQVICKFTDLSTWHEADAELADIVDCSLYLEGDWYCGGTGQVTAAANHGDHPEDLGGNVTLKCTFDNFPLSTRCHTLPQ